MEGNFKFGPFHRLENETTQTFKAALEIKKGGELWGLPRRGSNIPQVQAYEGPLPGGKEGLEFYAEIEPDGNTVPGMPRWTGPRKGVKIKDDFAIIRVKVTKIEGGGK